MPLAGGFGAGLRLIVDTLANRWSRPLRESALPWATILINATGSFLLGVVTAAASVGAASEGIRLVLGAGVCGGYTTFSTAMVETLRVDGSGRRGHRALAAANWLGTLFVTTGLAALGWALGSHL